MNRSGEKPLILMVSPDFDPSQSKIRELPPLTENVLLARLNFEVVMSRKIATGTIGDFRVCNGN